MSLKNCKENAIDYLVRREGKILSQDIIMRLAMISAFRMNELTYEVILSKKKDVKKMWAIAGRK